MVRLLKYLFVLIQVFPLFSCVRDLHDNSGQRTVQLRIGIPEENLGVDVTPWTKAYVDATQYEDDIHSLRVIVSTGPKTIIYNELFDESEIEAHKGDGNPYEVVLEIPDIPYGPASFYVIANESSIWGGKHYTTETILKELEQSTKLIYKEPNAGNRFFPQTGPKIVDSGLPMSGSNTPVDVGDDMPPVEINLIRCVAKITLTVENQTSESIILNTVKFGKFFGDSFNMFRTVNLDVPNSIEYYSFEYVSDNIAEIPTGNKTKELSLYLYPSHAFLSTDQESPYTIEVGIAIGSGTRVYPKQVFMDRSYIIRNNVINLNAKITTTGLDVDFRVAEWDDYSSGPIVFE